MSDDLLGSPIDRSNGMGVVYIWCTRRSIPKDVRECVDRRLTVVHVNDPWAWPRKCDYYVQHAQLSAASERAAAVMDAMPVVMPNKRPTLTPKGMTAADWLRSEIWTTALVRDVY